MYYTSLEQLTPPMQRALLRMYGDAVLVDGGLEKHKIHPATLDALKDNGLIGEGRDGRARPTWKPTARGLQVIATQAPRLLAARSEHGYTTNPALALPGEGEAVSDTDLARYAREAQEREASSTYRVWINERRELDLHLANLQHALPNRAVLEEIRIIRLRLKAIDRQLKTA